MRQSLIFAFEVIAGKQKNAEKENDFIYHERIPKFEDLEIPEGQLLAKPVSFDAQDRSILGDDLFAQLLPVSVIKAISVYEEQKTNLRRKVEERIDRKNEELEDYFRRLNLDEINVDSEPDKLALPEDLLTANATFSAQPEAFAEIVNKLHELGNRSREAEAKLNELKVRLDAIDLPEIISDKGYEVISRTLQKRIELFTENRDKDTNLQNTIADESEHIRILSMPISEFKKTIVEDP
uniref:BRO1 domain-containing protein n=1 Tax=Steinernema glaseri TaxID=37863 RepID=A0A1I7Y3Z3_9BILA